MWKLQVCLLYASLWSLLQVQDASAGLQGLTEVNNNFSRVLYQEVIKGKEGENILFSPISLTFAMAVIRAGAEGSTFQQIEDALHFEKVVEEQHMEEGEDEQTFEQHFKELMTNVFKDPTNQYTINMVNKLFGRNNFTYNNDFKHFISDYYKSNLKKTDFDDLDEARSDMNSEVQEQTEIHNLVAEGAIDKDSFLVLVDAVLFRGIWKEAFHLNDTEPRPFFKISEDIDTETMYTEANLSYRVIPSLKSSVLRIPYTGKEVAMYFILPMEKRGIRDLETALKDYDLEKIFKDMEPMRVKATLPKFSLEVGTDLRGPLRSAGIQDLFNQSAADLSRMVDEEGLYLSQAIHGASLTIDERGKADPPASTNFTRVAEEPFFNADHPFMFIVREETTGAILLMGRLSDPMKVDVTSGTTLWSCSWLVLCLCGLLQMIRAG